MTAVQEFTEVLRAERLRAFLGSGELPEGWVCIRARPVAQDAGR